MAEITAKLVKELREQTGSGMMDCKKALQATNGNLEEAVVWLRENGMAQVSKKATRAATEGLVDSYIHANGRVGVLIEINIETDYAAANEEFKAFVKDCAMQVAAMNPLWVRREDVPAEVTEKEVEIARNEALNDGKPEKIVDKIAEGRLNKFYEENCLMEQESIKVDKKTIEELRQELVLRIGENVVVRRFVRYELGEGLEKKEENFADEVMKQLQ